jgi:FKBP-type peptidyl-prolyl cis-trans isomerase (trigger factor)
LGQTVDPKLNIPELIRDAYRNGAEMSKRIFQYTWTDTRTYRVVEKGGKVKAYPEQVYEVFPNRVNGRFLLRRLVKENGVPLSPERASKELARLAKELEKDEQDAEKEGRELASRKSSP